jgi:protein ImuA
MDRAALLARLKAEVSALEGRAAQLSRHADDGLWRFGGAALEAGFPAGLALSAMHEFAPAEPAHFACAVAVAVRLLLRLPEARRARPWLWVQPRHLAHERGQLCAAALAAAGLAPERLIFVEVGKMSEAHWAIEEGLHTSALGAVVATGIDMDFTTSRRLALACASGAVPLLHLPERPSLTTAAATRWEVSPRPSAPDPWVAQGCSGRPRWQLALQRARQDVAAKWPANFEVEWDDAALCFDLVPELVSRSVAAPTAWITRAA